MKKIACAVFVTSLFSVSAHGALLNLTVDYPLVTGGISASLDYDADGGAGGNGLLTGSSFLSNYNPDGSGSQSLTQIGQLTFEVVIDPSTGEGLSGSLTATGDVGSGMETLFGSSQLVDFGFGGTGLFEAVFVQAAGSSLAPAGAQIGLIHDSAGSFSSGVSFDSDFTTNPLKNDIFLIPEPATLAAI